MRVLLFAFITFLFSSWAGAAALVQTASGDVRVERAGVMSRLGVNQRVDAGANILTGADGRAVLKFDDGQMTALGADTTFKIDVYQFDALRPEEGRIGFSLLRGAMRLLTGLIGERNKSNFSLRTSTATIGIRGTDFLVGINSPTYLSVNQGAITATNSAGTATFGTGATGMVASTSTLATPIAASALPSSIAAAFTQLAALPLAATVGATTASGASSTPGASGAAGAQSAVGAAAGGLGVGAIAVGAVTLGVLTTLSSSSTGTTGTQ